MIKRFILLALITFSFSTGISAQAPQEKFATVFGAKMRYLEAGDPAKPTVVLLHGLGGNGDTSWAFNVGALAASYHVIAPDQIGFGKSDKPIINYRVSSYVDFLEKFLTGLKLPKVSLVGNSMGGWISVLFTAKYPAKVEKLVLVDAAGYTPPKGFDYKTLQKLNPSTRDGMRELTKLVFYNSALFSSDAAVDQFMAGRIAAGDGYALQTLIRTIELGDDYYDNQVKTIKQPTLIIWGKQDGLVLLADGERLKREITGSELIVFDQCGHVPQAEKAKEFNEAVLKFLAK